MENSVIDNSSFANLIGELEGDVDYVDNMQIDSCYPDKTQPRYKNLDADGVADIRATLQMPPYRIWMPILVHEIDSEGHKIIMGGRRWLASSLEHKETIPALVVKEGVDSDKIQLLIQLIENTARKDLDPREEGQTFIRLKAMGMTGKDIAKTRNKKESFISECIMLAEMENDRSLSFINDLMEKGICVDPTTITALIRIARKNKNACEKLINWAIENDCLNRKWAQSLKGVDLGDSLDDQLNALDELDASKNTLKKNSNAASKVNASAEKDEPSNIKEEEQESINDEVNSFPDNEEANNTTEHNVDDTNTSNVSSEKGFNKRPLNKAIISVTHNNILASILLDRVDMEEGFTWIVHQNGDDTPIRVSVDDLSIVHVG